MKDRIRTILANAHDTLTTIREYRDALRQCWRLSANHSRIPEAVMRMLDRMPDNAAQVCDAAADDVTETIYEAEPDNLDAVYDVRFGIGPTFPIATAVFRESRIECTHVRLLVRAWTPVPTVHETDWLPLSDADAAAQAFVDLLDRVRREATP